MWTLIKVFPSREEWNKTLIQPGMEIINSEYSHKNKSGGGEDDKDNDTPRPKSNSNSNKKKEGDSK